MISRTPRLIARCADVADVITAVHFGRRHGLRVSIRGGGHKGGLGVCDDGLVIDLSLIKFVHVDTAERTVRVGGGSTWGDVDHATHAFGLAVPSGIISTTGVGGLTLGGGMGHLTRQYGLTIDNLLAADVVLANGNMVVASADDNSDLFWALRGGGGNFGVVTSFLFQAHPVHTVCAGPMLWGLDQAAGIMKFHADDFRRVSADDPARRGEEITLFAVGMGELEPSIAGGELPSTPPPQLVDPPCVVFSDPGTRRAVAAASALWAGARLSRSLVFRERLRLSVIGEVFNVYNNANLSGYGGDLTNAAFGQPTSRATQIFGSGGPRAFQLALRVSF